MNTTTAAAVEYSITTGEAARVRAGDRVAATYEASNGRSERTVEGTVRRINTYLDPCRGFTHLCVDWYVRTDEGKDVRFQVEGRAGRDELAGVDVEFRRDGYTGTSPSGEMMDVAGTWVRQNYIGAGGRLAIR